MSFEYTIKLFYRPWVLCVVPDNGSKANMQALGASSPEETATAQINDDREHEAVPSQAAGELSEDHGAGRHTAMNGDNPFLGADMGHPPGPRFTPSSPGTGPRPAPPAPHQRHDQPALAEGHFVDDGVPHAAEYADRKSVV